VNTLVLKTHWRLGDGLLDSGLVFRGSYSWEYITALRARTTRSNGGTKKIDTYLTLTYLSLAYFTLRKAWRTKLSFTYLSSMSTEYLDSSLHHFHLRPTGSLQWRSPTFKHLSSQARPSNRTQRVQQWTTSTIWT